MQAFDKNLPLRPKFDHHELHALDLRIVVVRVGLPAHGLQRSPSRMNARTGVISQIEPAVEQSFEEGDIGFDDVPGMPLVGFVTGSTFGLGLWCLLGLVAWHFVG